MRYGRRQYSKIPYRAATAVQTTVAKVGVCKNTSLAKSRTCTGRATCPDLMSLTRDGKLLMNVVKSPNRAWGAEESLGNSGRTPA
jgi:hypothetical protein